MYSVNNLTTFNSKDFLDKIIKRGNIIDKEKKELLINFEKKYQDKKEGNTIEEILDNDKISDSEKRLIKLFKKYNPKINYISYILIINSLDVQDIKNLNRYIIINWNKTKNSLKGGSEYDSIRLTNFSEISTLENYHDKKKLLDKFISLIIEFINKEKINNDINFSVHMIFIINSLQNYFCHQ